MQARLWRNYLSTGLIAMAIGLLIAFSAIVLLDPFGRLGLAKSAEIGFQEERPSMVSRALDPQFNSVIIGNSTSIPLMPEHLDQLTGDRFVSLSISGSDGPASIATLKFFLAHHRAAKIVVVALLSEIWCGATFNEHRPFPFWLYSTLPSYFWGLAENTSFDLIRTTLSDREKLRASDYHAYIGLDGYHTLTGPFAQPSYTAPNLVRARLIGGKRPEKSANPSGIFPAIQTLAAVIAKPSTVFYVLLWTPRYVNYTPAPGSDADNTDRACKAELEQMMSRFSNVKIVDRSEADRPENSDTANFLDVIHYRRAMAAHLEESIQEAIPDALKGS